MNPGAGSREPGAGSRTSSMKYIPGVLPAVVVMLAGFWLADLIVQQILAM